MIKAKIIIETTKQEIPIRIKNRKYKKLSFWKKLEFLFFD